MKKIFFGVMAFSALSGCMNMKFVTARTWVGGDTMYVAYTDYNKMLFSSTTDARVLRCNRTASNVLACADEKQLGDLLNAGSSTASGH